MDSKERTWPLSVDGLTEFGPGNGSLSHPYVYKIITERSVTVSVPHCLRFSGAFG